MWKLLIVGLVFWAESQAIGQVSSYLWDVTLKVSDDNGEAVPGANARIAYDNQGDSFQIKGLTDTNGTFHASHTDDSIDLGILIEKYGYYSTRLSYQLYPPDSSNNEKVVANRNPTLNLVLNKIRHPIPMYAKKEETKIPTDDKPIGFDLMIGDWVAPFGKGTSSDFLFTSRRKITNPSTFEADLLVAFSNTNDGIVVLPAVPKTGSELLMPGLAPTNGYQSELALRYTTTERPAVPLGYYFRVRTVTDESGKITSALYGKIQGDIRFYVGTKAPRAGVGFTYYLNPTSNSRNVEFDPKRNLMMKISQFEAATKP